MREKLLSSRCAVASGVAALTAAGLFLRRPDAFLTPQFYAEDGLIFFKQAHDFGAESLFIRYAGYLHLFPRLVALLCSELPTRWIPAAYLGAATIAVIAATLFCLSDRVPIPFPQRIAMALALTFSPTLNEVLNNLTNVQWTWALVILLFVVLRPAETAEQWTFDLLALTFLGLTGPFLLVFSPLFAARWAFQRTRYAAATLGVAAVTGAIQFSGMTLSRAEGAPQWLSAEWLRIVIRLFRQMFAAWWDKPVAAQLQPVLIVSVICLIVSAAIAFEAWRARDWTSLVFLAGAAAALGTAMYTYRANPSLMVGGASRYLYIPTVAFVWVFIRLAARRPAVAGPLLILCFASFVASHQEAPFANLDWPAQAACIDLGQSCRFEVNPPGFGWVVTIDPRR